ncbi:MAG: M28 family peptidase [bacterium]
MGFLRYFVIFLAVLPPQVIFAQNNNFNADSAYAYLEHLCVTIGPRPMGSANERTALGWTVKKFREFGAHEAYVMKVPQAKKSNNVINTNSGVAIGVFEGESDSTIVIGGHIDSSGPEIPGANDNASGSACVIELARVWSQHPRHYRLVFAAFGGEEKGLAGSKYFVDHYHEMKNVALMLQIDMAGSDEALIPFFDLKSHQAPAWLVEDAYDIDRTLGLNSLNYPTHFFSLSTALQAIGSDHIPFQMKNIPAICFTTGVNTSPIHTPQDKIDFIHKPMLARTGLLVDGLVRKYQEHGIPAPRKGHYMLWQIFGGLFFMPLWLIITFDILALLLGVWAFIYSRKTRLQIEKVERVRFSGIKILFITVVVAIFAQLGEAIMQFIKGLRYPWLVHIKEYLWYAAIWAVAGLWVSLQLARKWRFSPDPYVYVKRAVILLLVLTALLASASWRLAWYPGLTLALLSLAVLIPNVFIKSLTIILAPLPLFRLMFMEAFPFLARDSAEGGFQISTIGDALLYSLLLTSVLVIWFLPVIYAMVSLKPLTKALKRFRSPAFGLVMLLAIFGYGAYLFYLPSYNDVWRAEIHADAVYDLRSKEGKLQLTGNEYFRNVNVAYGTFNKQYDDRIHKDVLPIPFTADWITLFGNETVLSGEKDTLSVGWQLTSQRPWYETSVKIQVDTLDIVHVKSDMKSNPETDEIRYIWYGNPAETLHITATFLLPPGARLIREITAVYPEMPIPLEVTAEFGDVRYRTTVTYRDTLTFK